jgi:hypothetical protein
MRRALPVSLNAHALGVALALGALLFAGCNNGPTEPNRTLAFAGTLARSASKVETFDMKHTGNVRLTLTDLQQVAADGTMAPPLFGLPLALGNPAADATCAATTSFAMGKGTVVSLGLERGTYCILLTEPTLVPEGSSIAYQLRAEITD